MGKDSLQCVAVRQVVEIRHHLLNPHGQGEFGNTRQDVLDRLIQGRRRRCTRILDIDNGDVLETAPPEDDLAADVVLAHEHTLCAVAVPADGADGLLVPLTVQTGIRRGP